MEAYQQLEHVWKSFSNMPHTVACSTGSSALHLALEALELPKGSYVAVPEFTMIACARAVTMAGLVPVFVDCGLDLLMDPDRLRDVVDKYPIRLTAVMPVHIYGRRCSMFQISEIANRNNLRIVEDMSEIHGVAPYHQTDAACWSCYKNKIIGGEEGGMISFRSARSAELARKMRSHGFTDDHNFLHTPRGINARLSNAHADLILRSFWARHSNIQRRLLISSWYDAEVRAWSPESLMPPRDVCWVYDLSLRPFGVDNEHVVRQLNERGVAARVGFKPMSMQEEYRSDMYESTLAYRLSKEVIYLPVTPTMTRSQVGEIVDSLKRIIGA